MNWVAPVYPKRRWASPFTARRKGPASYEQRQASIDAGSPEVVAPVYPERRRASLPASYEQPPRNIGQRTADASHLCPRFSNRTHAIPAAAAERSEPAHANPGAVAVRWEPPHSCGGGALQRSEKSSPLMMRFSAGQFGTSPSSSSIRKPGPLNLINCNSPAAPNRAQSNRLTNAPFLDLKISKNLSEPLRKVFRLEPTPILCFHRLTANFNRTLVSVRLSRFDAVIKRLPTLVAHRTASQQTQISIFHSHG
jgi:hypothetical protein